ncbi:hypothetical protein [Bifidobacterium boum]|uniref:hypothetical protein n=1 Tax=Bifidobacterium boum TaxID=78343 RepID=UPI003F8EE288
MRKGPPALTGQLRKNYATTLHDLAILMRRVHLVAYKVVKRGRGGAGYVRPAFTPALVDLQAMDVENMAETTISEVAAGIGLWGDWQTLLPRMVARLTDLCARQTAADDIARLQAETRVLRAWLGDTMDSQQLTGICPECHAPIYQPASSHSVTCRCGWTAADPQPARLELQRQWSRLHITVTPAGLSEWIRDNLGVQVNRKTCTTWLLRGKLQATRAGDGCWTIPLSAIARQVQRHASE